VESASAELSGASVEAVLASDGTRITSLTADGGASLRLKEAGETRQLSGRRIVFGIGTASRALEKISALGDAEFSSLSPSGEENLNGAEIHLELDPVKGLPTRIQSWTGVRFRMKRGTEQTIVAADRLAARLAPGTKNFESLQVNGRASLSVDSATDSSGQELKAEEIWMSFRQTSGEAALEELRASGSAMWTLRPRPGKDGVRRKPARTLEAALLEMFYSSGGNFLESGHASGKVVMSEVSGEKTARAEQRRLFADEARFEFFPGNNRLKGIRAEGHVRIVYEKKPVSGGSSGLEKFQTESEKMQAAFDIEDGESVVRTVSQWGGFRYRDASRTAAAGRSDYDARKALLVLADSPRITSDDMGTTTGERIEYDQKQRVLLVHKRVRSRLSGKEGEGPFFGTSSSSSPGIVTADELRYSVESGRARYTGDVQLLSENGQLQAEALEVFKGGERVDAQGKITHRVPVRETSNVGQQAGGSKKARNPDPEPMMIRSDLLHYVKESNTITYTGNVRLNSRDLSLTSATLDAVMDPGGKRIERAKAQGNVRILQGNKECKGESADYYLDPGKLVVVGNPAEIFDPGRGRSVARRLTSFIADDRILLEKQ
jgi:lipopolysaccharide export system protein LptA